MRRAHAFAAPLAAALALVLAEARGAATVVLGAPRPDTTAFRTAGVVAAGYVTIFDVPAVGVARGFPQGAAKLLHLSEKNAADPRAIRSQLAAACGLTQAGITVAHETILAAHPPHYNVSWDANLTWGVGFDDDGARVVARLCSTNAAGRKIAPVMRVLAPGDVLLAPLAPGRGGRSLVLALHALRFDPKSERFATGRFKLEHGRFYDGLLALPHRDVLQFPRSRFGPKPQAPCP